MWTSWLDGGQIPNSMQGTFAICRASFKEYLFHLFLDCGKYTEERKEFLKLDLLTREMGFDCDQQSYRKLLLRLILGEDPPEKGGKLTMSRIISTLKYLKIVVLKRAGLLSLAFFNDPGPPSEAEQ
ncbi:hypothetical protein NUSPORA_00786 [Nucleospora cyclopteri]